MKSVQAVTRQFCTRLRSIIKDAWAGTGEDTETRIRELIEYHISRAYFEGLQEGGIDPEDFDEDMSAEADSLIFQQFEHVSGLVIAIEEAQQDESKRDAVLLRAGLWCNAVDSAGLAGLNKANATEMVTWRLGKTELHCTTCAWLDGQTHRRKWFDEKGYIPRQAGSETLECGGWQCDCSLVPAKKKRNG